MEAALVQALAAVVLAAVVLAAVVLAAVRGSEEVLMSEMAGLLRPEPVAL